MAWRLATASFILVVFTSAGAIGVGQTLVASAGSPLLVASAATTSPPAGQSVTIRVTYLEDWPAQARQAFDYAAGIWAARLNSPVTIAICA
mgnify:CR=1 FL=1